MSDSETLWLLPPYTERDEPMEDGFLESAFSFQISSFIFCSMTSARKQTCQIGELAFRFNKYKGCFYLVKTFSSLTLMEIKTESSQLEVIAVSEAGS